MQFFFQVNAGTCAFPSRAEVLNPRDDAAAMSKGIFGITVCRVGAPDF